MDVNEQTFAVEVLEASQSVPVLVDFWAPWCGPCRVLGPVLEKLEAASQGRFKLAKINTEDCPNLSRQFSVYSIPEVKLFKDGKVIAAFTGALPKDHIERFLDTHIPTPAKAAYDQALAAHKAGQGERAKALYEQVLEHEPSHPGARMHLAELILRENTERALALVNDLEGNLELGERVESLQRLAALPSRIEIPSESKAWPRYREGIEAFLRGDDQEALRAWIDVIKIDRQLDDDGARKNCVAVFHILGDEHPITRSMRPEFASALF